MLSENTPISIRFADEFEENLYRLSKRFRNIRKDVQNAIRAAEKVHKLSEDVIKRFLDILQKSTDSLIEKIEIEAKQREQSINRE